MPYHVALATTLDRPQLYEVTVLDDFDRTTARALGDWIEVARLNPEARFSLDLSRADHVDPVALRRFRSNHGDLLADGRLEVVGAPARSLIVEAPMITSMVVPLLELASNVI